MQLSFPHIRGPKCLRLLEVVHSATANSRRRKGTKSISVRDSRLEQNRSIKREGVCENKAATDANGEEVVVTNEDDFNAQDLQLKVVLHFDDTD
ncbi:hypothetical protein TSUD_212870 [Trifolium subterraneum]|uniref:Uncharacterized protein n=1 Tax=Trifolium subterraneum TaxID=3900 RepID=A0A2Z6MVF1_TRISU|nr:hypothetical protein TSUD_212870 [Trifolium subterraneum]